MSAMSGAMGGSASEEFLAPCESGEDTFVRSEGGYAANVEAVVTVAPEPIALEGLPAAHVEDTPTPRRSRHSWLSPTPSTRILIGRGRQQTR